ncbi:MAG: VPLPA-CTERM sorting domain-containing protein [Candidatus Thiodiazotropha sp. (ex Lucinoma aequizonata)]|nr:VPLPA-CTERM sorting domain-containing protein [Candidatus Thiodiazotropha sp. (ex Lucinoma aequizonata)]MCU7895397.1 VPLPA-CTERM sorting domain-containing protein [Candidatus Thiodiazotropha sp. (ex Lucinoma aequizonata)]MCU7901964.1 VPLPA-CTERM sorting domain-containing protein [Candidatus Thiodiazotropha sp. (ex Lucinoma aequizonata)]MCU7909608.1 VPLPA-CTERM sorting domain-containing protein [Candidatus Thiodiazotropha sp. (ex Lucinoma aequizonata)]MCU7913743.1 VPLPA-CTERM sorting domain-c
MLFLIVFESYRSDTSYVFTVSGFVLDASDPKVYSDYSFKIQAVPLPAAAWLFGSALIGFVSFSRRRKV